MGYLDKDKTDALNKIKRERKIGNLDSPKNPFDYYERAYGTVPRDENRAPFQWVSEVAYKNVHRIVTRGYDTTELMEEGYGIVDVLFIDYQARIPTVEEEKMLNYVMIMALEDGLSIPAAMSRLVAKSKTFLTQACGASIMAFGHAYGAYSAFGNRLDDYLKMAENDNLSVEEAAEILVEENLHDEALGVSGLMLKDPAAKRMLARAEKLGVAGKYIDFTTEIVKAAQKISDEPVDIDMLGAIGAVMLDLGFTPEATWAVLAVTRSYAAGAHYIEEIEREEYTRLGQELTPEEDYDGPEDRSVPPIKDRATNSRPALCRTPDEWKQRFEKMKKVSGSGFSIIEEIEDPSKKSGIKKVGKL
ncbi:citrate/2-methylcitrate synthase [Desulfococcaceae bacterium HSG9]|nr:citrate/2-methylcitrate synthase [Desulfococcaceae bacterium HSG9]